MRVSRSQYDVGLETLSDHLEAQAMWQQAYETSRRCPLPTVPELRGLSKGNGDFTK